MNKERLVFGQNIFLVEKTKTQVSDAEDFAKNYVDGLLDGIFEKKEIKFECQICNKVFASKRFLNSHKRDVHVPLVPCAICSKKIKCGANMKRHIDNVHNTPKRNSSPMAHKRKRNESNKEYSRSHQYKKAKLLTEELISSPSVTPGILENIVKKLYRDFKHIIDTIEEKGITFRLHLNYYFGG